MHQAIHSTTRPYKCEYCSKAFTQHGALVRHTRTHTSARPYACRLCPSAFNDYSVLRRHMMGVHKLCDVAELRRSVQAACAEARLAQHPTAVSLEVSQSTSSASITADNNVNTSTASSIEDAVSVTATCTNALAAAIPVKPELHLGTTSGGQLLAVLTSVSQDHPDTRTSASDSLPHYFITDDWRHWRTVDSQQQNL